MNILKGNKLIAEFMNFRWIEEDANWYVPTDEYSKFGASFKVDDLKFHKSWDWLMPVVEKIGDIEGCCFELHEGNNHVAQIWYCPKPYDLTVFSEKDNTLINNTWEVIVEFIQWYNKQ